MNEGSKETTRNKKRKMGDSKKMETRALGKTGLYVSELCFGCMTIGSSDANTWGLPTAREEESYVMMNEYFNQGGNFYDTADIYGHGDSERVLGKWMSTKRREELVIATKVRGRMGSGANDVGLNRKHIMAGVAGSLERLNTPYIDLYQVHTFDPSTPLEETMRTLNDLVRSGKVHYLGVSNFSGYQLQKVLDLSERMGLEKFICLQPQYSLLCRSTEWDLIKICQDEGLGCIPWSPLAGGWLSGRYSRDMSAPEGGSRVAWAQKAGWKATNWDDMATEYTWKVLDSVKKVSEETGKSMSQVSLRWLMQRPGVTAPIIGAKNLEQLKDNLNTCYFTLSDEHMKILDDASHQTPPYPWGADFTKRRG